VKGIIIELCLFGLKLPGSDRARRQASRVAALSTGYEDILLVKRLEVVIPVLNLHYAKNCEGYL
jgi:hypothetical protein